MVERARGCPQLSFCRGNCKGSKSVQLICLLCSLIYIYIDRLFYFYECSGTLNSLLPSTNRKKKTYWESILEKMSRHAQGGKGMDDAYIIILWHLCHSHTVGNNRNLEILDESREMLQDDDVCFIHSLPPWACLEVFLKKPTQYGFLIVLGKGEFICSTTSRSINVM